MRDFELLSEADEKALSPIISTLLLVGVVILLGGTIGVTVFLFFSDTSDPGATVSFETSYATNNGTVNVTIYHATGDNLDGEKLTVVGSETGPLPLTVQGTFSAGDPVVSGASVQPGERILVRYNETVDESYLILRETVPETILGSATPAATPTPTPTPTPTSTPTPGDGGGSVPGFRLPTIAVAIALVALITRRRRTRS
jgi:flagellin-like protein